MRFQDEVLLKQSEFLQTSTNAAGNASVVVDFQKLFAISEQEALVCAAFPDIPVVLVGARLQLGAQIANRGLSVPGVDHDFDTLVRAGVPGFRVIIALQIRLEQAGIAIEEHLNSFACLNPVSPNMTFIFGRVGNRTYRHKHNIT